MTLGSLNLRRLLTAAALVAAAAALSVACQGSPPAPQTPPPGAVYVSANQLVFEQAVVQAPAGEAFQMWFENREAIPHNVHVVDGSGASIMRGEVFNGPGARLHDIPALAPGTYKILCDVHPDMTAELVATN